MELLENHLPKTEHVGAYILGVQAALHTLNEYSGFNDVELFKMISTDSSAPDLSYSKAKELMRESTRPFEGDTLYSTKYRDELRKMSYFRGFISVLFNVGRPHVAFLVMNSAPRVMTFRIRFYFKRNSLRQ